MLRVANPACFIAVAVAIGSSQAQSARQLLPTCARFDALTVAERSSFNGMPLADQHYQGVTSMQAGFPVAPQVPVAMQPRQMVQPLPAGTERTLVAAPQFGAALAIALANDPSVDQATVPAAQSATSGQGTLSAMSVASEHTTSKPVPMPGLPAPPPDPSTAVAPAASSGTMPAGAAVAVEKTADGEQQSTEDGKTGQIATGAVTTRPRHQCRREFRAAGWREPWAASCAAIRRGDATEIASWRSGRAFCCRSCGDGKIDRGHRSCHGDGPHRSRHLGAASRSKRAAINQRGPCADRCANAE